MYAAAICKTDLSVLRKFVQHVTHSLAYRIGKQIAFVIFRECQSSAYDFSIYGGLSGRVAQVSADSIYDEIERENYYRVLIETKRSFIEKDRQKFAIVPGMITDVEIITGAKSILSYLLKPVSRAFDTALSEK